jgi:hypothetical protein
MGLDEHLPSLGENSIGSKIRRIRTIKNKGNVLVAGEDVSRWGMNNFPEHFDTSYHLLFLMIPFLKTHTMQLPHYQIEKVPFLSAQKH